MFSGPPEEVTRCSHARSCLSWALVRPNERGIHDDGHQPVPAGQYAPVHEELTATELAVSGSIPEELCGRYLRNGPNPVTEPDPATYHWFTGDGMVHGIRLRGGRAEWYRNRWVRAPGVAQALGEEPKGGPVHANMDFAANTNVIGHAGRTFAIVESGSLPYELTNELETVGPCDFDGTLAGGYTAHPKRDPQSGELYAVSYFWGWADDVDVSILDTNARVRSSRKVSMGGSISLHDCAITESTVVLLDLPVVQHGRRGRGSELPLPLAGRLPLEGRSAAP